MVDLCIICEGKTEVNFIKNKLANYFANKIILPITLPTGWDDGDIKKGGGVSYSQWTQKIREAMNQIKARYYTTFFDLYRIPSDIPCKSELDKLTDPYQKAQLCEQQFKNDILQDSFFPHVQPYEFEALLFASPENTSMFLSDDKHIQQKLKQEIIKIANSFTSPEHINGGEDTAPSKRIIKLHKKYHGMKTLAWIALDDIDTICSKCKHFNDWLRNICDRFADKPFFY